MLDILIKGGEVIDGTGRPRYRADVAIEGSQIMEVGILPGAEGRVVIDASNLAVAPGFIDMHSHADFLLPIVETAEGLLRQGITTSVVGQCGASPAPLSPDTRELVIAMQETEWPHLPWDEWSTFASYLDYLARVGSEVNVVPLVGQATLRMAVMGFASHTPTGEQMARMQTEAVQALAAGAFGVSTGLIYAPGSYASTEELIDLLRPVGARGGIYFSHIRDEGDRLLEALAEAIRIGRESGAPVQISHYKASDARNWPKAAEGLKLIEQARTEGLDVTADVYPYLAGNTTLSSKLPTWALEGGKEATLARLSDPAQRRKMAAAMEPSGWDKILVSRCPLQRAYEAHYVADLAAATGKPPHDWVFDALLECALEVQIISFTMCEENLRLELRHPAVMIGTDGVALAIRGPLADGAPHPRNYGTFARVLGRYVREEHLLTLEEAIWKMSGLPAQKLGLAGRGLVGRGAHADLVLFDPDTVADQGTYDAPHQYPTGIFHVTVNGRLAIDNGRATGVRAGQVLRRP